MLSQGNMDALYTVTPAKLASSDLVSQGHLWSVKDGITSCLRLISILTASYIPFRHIPSVETIGMMLSQGNTYRLWSEINFSTVYINAHVNTMFHVGI